MSRQSLLALSVVGVLGMFAAQSQAVTVSLADLTAPGAQPLVVGDKSFSGFVFNSAKLTASNVTVETLTGDTIGLRFRATWSTSLGSFVDSNIIYNVTVNSTTNAINGVGLAFGGAAASNGAVAAVGEQIRDLDTSSNVYNIAVHTDGTGPLADVTTSSATVNPTSRKLQVIKDISVTVKQGTTGSTASIEFVDNTFNQTPGGGTPPPIPEPASLALLPLALLGLGLRRKLVR